MPNARKALALSSEEQQITEVPSCRLRAVVASDLSWPGQSQWSGASWKDLGATS